MAVPTITRHQWGWAVVAFGMFLVGLWVEHSYCIGAPTIRNEIEAIKSAFARISSSDRAPYETLDQLYLVRPDCCEARMEWLDIGGPTWHVHIQISDAVGDAQSIHWFVLTRCGGNVWSSKGYENKPFKLNSRV